MSEFRSSHSRQITSYSRIAAYGCSVRPRIFEEVNSKLQMGDESMKEFISRMIKEHTGEVTYRQSNLLNSYIALYHLIRFHSHFFEKYEDEIKKIRSSLDTQRS